MHKMPHGMWLIKDEELYRCKFCKENDPENPVSTPQSHKPDALCLLARHYELVPDHCLTDVRRSVSLQLARGAGHVTELSCTLHVHKNEVHKTAEDRFVAL
jgi:hypothetical protein